MRLKCSLAITITLWLLKLGERMFLAIGMGFHGMRAPTVCERVSGPCRLLYSFWVVDTRLSAMVHHKTRRFQKGAPPTMPAKFT